MSSDELLIAISRGLNKPLTQSDIFVEEINVNHLKRIDKVFNKGLHYYLDPKPPIATKDASIFFRKTKFGTDLNFGAKKIVNQFEEEKISLSAIAKLAEIKTDRKLSVCNIQNDPKQTANYIRTLLYPEFNFKLKEFLRSLISKFAEYNILVFEFVETHNKKEKANIDGFFLKPNVIVLKRQQASFRREIFTLIHELAHYLLNEEEIEQLDLSNLYNRNLSEIEKWCNDFAYYFLVGSYDEDIEKIYKADKSNDYYLELIKKISHETHLSRIALYTRLLYKNKISQTDYNFLKAEFEEQYKLKKEEEKKQKELDKIEGRKIQGSAPKPINSPLLISTVQIAFGEGIITEYEASKFLKISPEKLESLLQ
ncbi:MAG: ImmA/IrrE family metallo-endopeptidase [Ignavibacteria bacterium]|nr:ImmA/IrrE family metallo-endopeptidase [Ignavibacteria bacterium]